MRRVLGAAFALSVLCLPAAAEEDCRLQIAASLPLTIDETNHIAIPAAIGDRAFTLTVDTGASNSSLRSGLADELKLKTTRLPPRKHFYIRGGIRLTDYTLANGFTLGKLKADGITFLIIPQDRVKEGMHDGILGETVLSNYDVDFDFAAGELNLFLPHRCPGKAVYWTQNETLIAKVPIEFSGSKLYIPLEIDGRKMRAVLDTGAYATVISLERDLPQFALTQDSPGMEPVGHYETPLRFTYTFKTLTFEGVTVNSPSIVVESDKLSHDSHGEMLLGMDILKKLHLFIAFQEKMLYISAADVH